MAEAAKKPGLSDYRRAFTHDWRKHMFALMSGPFSVLFAFGSVVAGIWSSWVAAAIFGLMAFLSAWYAGYEMWRLERSRADHLSARLEPAITPLFEEDIGVVEPELRNRGLTGETIPGSERGAKWVRFRVDATSETNVGGCSAALIGLAVKPLGVDAFKTIALPDAVPLGGVFVVRPRIPHRIAFLHTDERTNQLAVTETDVAFWPHHLEHVLKQPGCLLFDFAVNDGRKTQVLQVEVDWDGTWNRIKARQVSVS